MKRAWRTVDAVLLLDKPSGMSSNSALQVARRRFQAAKAGHGGTLDPLASGLLPVLFGEATKFSGSLLEGGKRYEAVVRLGIRTDTADADGAVIAERTVDVTDEALERALEGFRGDIEQVPPMHSALKRDGQPLYRLARKGIEVERAPRRVRIERLDLLGRDRRDLRLDIACSKGTYVRSIADDLGERLGCGAHLAALRRTGAGPFAVRDAWTLERLEALPDESLSQALLPPDRLVADLPAVELAGGPAERFLHGQAVEPGADRTPGHRRVYAAPGPRFLGVGECTPEGRLRPLRLVASNAQAAEKAR